MSRIFYDNSENRLIVLSYAGGTKFFNPLATELGYIHLESVNNPGKPAYILQVVREPIQRWMSWFDKQHIKEIFQRSKSSNKTFHKWCHKHINKSFIDNYFETAYYKIHYDGHTAYQCYWPKIYLKRFDTDWKYLRMEDINPYFLGKKIYKPKRDKNEYLGFWDIISPELRDYTLAKAHEIYKEDINWYNNLEFLYPKS